MHEFLCRCVSCVRCPVRGPACVCLCPCWVCFRGVRCMINIMFCLKHVVCADSSNERVLLACGGAQPRCVWDYIAVCVSCMGVGRASACGTGSGSGDVLVYSINVNPVVPILCRIPTACLLPPCQVVFSLCSKYLATTLSVSLHSQSPHLPAETLAIRFSFFLLCVLTICQSSVCITS